MYAFYADESGFTPSVEFEANQPILVMTGILIDFTKLNKAIQIFDSILQFINAQLHTPVSEIKFSEIRNKEPFRSSLPKIDERADLLAEIIKRFQDEINFKIFYVAIDNEIFTQIKKQEPTLRNKLTHPYLCSAYKLLSQLDKFQSGKKKNKGKTFVVFDEQNQFQEKIERLVANPLHVKQFEQVFDTVYFGKSHYSKLIQIADLLAGMIRYYFVREKAKEQSSNDYWATRIQKILLSLHPVIIHKDCFDSDMQANYRKIELHF